MPNFYLEPRVATPAAQATPAAHAPSLSARRALYSGNCLVFLHLEKSGGTSVKRTFDRVAAAQGEARLVPARSDLSNPDVHRQQDGLQGSWLTGARPSPPGPRAGRRRAVTSSVIGFTSANATCPSTGLPPSVFAVVREPTARLVSAYTFCQAWPYDQLCGSAHVVPSRMSLEEWASHWGNYLFRQLLVASAATFVRLLDAAGARPAGPWYAYQKAALCRRTRTCQDLGKWFTLKRALGGLDRADSAEGRAALSALLAALPRSFAVVGLMERWDESMALFAEALDVAEFRNTGVKQRETHGSERWATRSAALRAEARNSSRIQQHIAADLAIYERMRVMFEQQLVVSKSLSGLPA
mmetsp:Transcript_5935/g.17332  ORF Transcript_5935/g.17332 Transcript_5935/m.17332 type:complete len:355 (-) Transcript_5935:23-1087(-)